MSAQSTVTMSTTASTRVFLLPELLGSIISCLKKVDILTRAQRVSHTWKNAVASPQVQDKLWRGEGKKPAVMPIRFVNESTDNSLHDIGMPIYKMPVASDRFQEDSLESRDLLRQEPPMEIARQLGQILHCSMTTPVLAELHLTRVRFDTNDDIDGTLDSLDHDLQQRHRWIRGQRRMKERSNKGLGRDTIEL
jgi:hypothetical protein